MTDRLAKLCENVWFCFAAIFGISFLTTILPVLIGGLHASGDLGVYLGFAQEIRLAIEQGRYFPGWANDTLGYGSVGIRFYPPVGYYTSALASFIVGDWYAAVCIFLFVWMAVGCWGIFLFVREWTPPVTALLAAALYAIMPFHLAEIYQFTLYGEFAASAILPFCFLYATRLCRGNEWSDVLGFAISSAALVLTHIPTTLIGAAAMAVYVLLLIEKPRFARTIMNFAISTTIALAASAFYWVRVVTELDWLAHAQPQYSASLGGRANWFFPYLLTATDSPEFLRPVLRSFEAMVVLTAALLIPPILLIVLGRNVDLPKRRIVTALSVVGTAGLFMLSYASYFIWDRVELLQKIQFPWRWLTVVSVAAVAAFVLTSWEIIKNSIGPLRTVAIVFLVALIGLIFAYDVRKNFMYGNVATPSEFDSILRAGESPADSSFAAWWPVWARSEALAVKEKVVAGERSIEIVEWVAASREFRIGEGPEGKARVATFYYPHWKAVVNDEVVELGKDENGAMAVKMPAIASSVRLTFEEPPLNRFCMMLSMIAWLAIAAVIIFLRVNRRDS